MNQSILFVERQVWDSQRKVIIFPAQQGGHSIDCVISAKQLQQLSQQPVNDQASALQAFELCRFDIEELAEEQIELEAFNTSGEIELD